MTSSVHRSWRTHRLKFQRCLQFGICKKQVHDKQYYCCKETWSQSCLSAPVSNWQALLEALSVLKVCQLHRFYAHKPASYKTLGSEIDLISKLYEMDASDMELWFYGAMEEYLKFWKPCQRKCSIPTLKYTLTDMDEHSHRYERTLKHSSFTCIPPSKVNLHFTASVADTVGNIALSVVDFVFPSSQMRYFCAAPLHAIFFCFSASRRLAFCALLF